MLRRDACRNLSKSGAISALSTSLPHAFAQLKRCSRINNDSPSESAITQLNNACCEELSQIAVWCSLGDVVSKKALLHDEFLSSLGLALQVFHKLHRQLTGLSFGQATYPDVSPSSGGDPTPTAVSCGLKVKPSASDMLPANGILQLLAVIKNLAEASDVRPDLARRGAIQMLCRVLSCLMTPYIAVSGTESSKPQNSNSIASALVMPSHVIEAAKVAVAAVFSLCRLDYVRCETAVKSGIVQNLLVVVRYLPSLRQLVVTLLCDFAHASSFCRQVLLNERVMPLFWDQVFGDLPYWRHLALESISVILKVHIHSCRLQNCISRLILSPG
jgi:hypothetical protein